MDHSRHNTFSLTGLVEITSASFTLLAAPDRMHILASDPCSQADWWSKGTVGSRKRIEERTIERERLKHRLSVLRVRP